MKKKIVFEYMLINIILILILFGISMFTKTKFIHFAMLYMFTPLIATFFLNRKYRFKIFAELKRIKITKWYLIAWLLPLLIAHISLGINLLFPNVSLNDAYKVLTLNQILAKYLFSYLIMLLSGLTINTIFALGEEFGWRALLYNQIRQIGFWKSSFVIGFLWGIWHIPLILGGYNYPNYPVKGSLLFVLLCILMTPIYILLKDKGESVILPAIFHGTFNASIGISITQIKGGNELITSGIGLSGVITFLILDILILLYLKSKKIECEI